MPSLTDASLLLVATCFARASPKLSHHISRSAPNVEMLSVELPSVGCTWRSNDTLAKGPQPGVSIEASFGGLLQQNLPRSDDLQMRFSVRQSTRIGDAK